MDTYTTKEEYLTHAKALRNKAEYLKNNANGMDYAEGYAALIEEAIYCEELAATFLANS